VTIETIVSASVDTAAPAARRLSRIVITELTPVRAVLAVAACAVVLYVTNHGGIGVSPDSAAYLAAGRSLAQSAQWLHVDGAPLVEWPPLFPTLIALFSAIRVPELAAIRYINAISFALLSIVIYQAALIDTKTRRLAALAASLVVINPWLSLTYSHFWSDPPFLTLLGLFLLRLPRLASHRNSEAIVTGSIVSAAILTRYVGVSLLAVLVITVLIRPCGEWRDRFRTIIISSAVAIAPVLLWLLRNWLVTGTLAGERGATVDTFVGVATAIGHNITRLFVPVSMAKHIPGFVVFAFTVLTPFILAVRWLRRNDSDQISHSSVAALTVSVYLLTLSLMATVSVVNTADERLMSPAAPPLILLLVGILGRAIGAAPSRLAPPLGIATAGTLIVLLSMISLTRTAELPARWQGEERLSRLRVRTSDLVPLVRNLGHEDVIVSNDPATVFVATGRRVGYSPRQTRYHSLERIAEREIQSLQKLVRARKVFLVWIAHPLETGQLSREELKKVFELLPVHAESGNHIYRLNLRP
jgi:4-amino-4-deoxy-L-arabinose transferase-like glycosyltransferase